MVQICERVDVGFEEISPLTAARTIALPERYAIRRALKFVGLPPCMEDLVEEFAASSLLPDWRTLRRAILTAHHRRTPVFCSVDQEMARRFIEVLTEYRLGAANCFVFRSSGILVLPKPLTSKWALKLLEGTWLELFIALAARRVFPHEPPPLARVIVRDLMRSGCDVCEIDLVVRARTHLIAIVEAKGGGGNVNELIHVIADYMGIPPRRRILVRTSAHKPFLSAKQMVVGARYFADYLHHLTLESYGPPAPGGHSGYGPPAFSRDTGMACRLPAG